LSKVSEITGLSKGYLSKLESGAVGAANPSRSTLAALARALPSFRPLAHTLAPGQGADQLDYAGMLSSTPRVPPGSVLSGTEDERPELASASAPVQRPIHLGWRELEILAALIALESAALPFRITAPLLVRATGRDVSSTQATLEHLVHDGIINVAAPSLPGGPFAFRLTADAAARLGVTRLGDILLLAATLIAGATPIQHDAASPVPSVQRQAHTKVTHEPG
jgi:transcriptional regulator with XRE-family HTH domain